ncbi:MAG: hypothetical protein NZ849_05575 [Meiothermus sp.]|uniref:hypothetical protein n=1 Tax=Meiothermus sp. TaxID=1955249 RepID=UPI0025E6666A|nr:hypothetical protein [Meiothermus sp.]MCS7194370.1 hypothetical protein [Meiothermus sp.]MDW8089851.1 hypothetical protein [Meiothermus sp.]MDW8481723.1 hypothetical protein [Meiothermus sp.]
MGYGFLGYQGGFQGGGGGFGTATFGEVSWAFGGESYGGAGQSGGVFLTGPLIPFQQIFLLPAVGLGGEERGGNRGFLLDVGLRAFLFPSGAGWAVGLGAGYAVPLGFSGGGAYLRLLIGGGSP